MSALIQGRSMGKKMCVNTSSFVVITCSKHLWRYLHKWPSVAIQNHTAGQHYASIVWFSIKKLTPHCTSSRHLYARGWLLAWDLLSPPVATQQMTGCCLSSCTSERKMDMSSWARTGRSHPSQRLLCWHFLLSYVLLGWADTCRMNRVMLWSPLFKHNVNSSTMHN